MIRTRVANIASSVTMSKEATTFLRCLAPGHCLPMKIHGESRSHSRAIIRNDIKPRTTVAARTIWATTAWPVFAVSRERRRITEHFATHIVIMKNRSEA